jgi:hypothetical protein
VEVRDEPSLRSWNPSWRRDGIAIEFCCEGCGSIGELTIAQHKGVTLVGWREKKERLTQSENFKTKIERRNRLHPRQDSAAWIA